MKKLGGSLAQSTGGGKGKLKAEVAGPTPEAPKDPMDDYQARDHFDTLVKAHGIMQDPDKMKKVHALAGRHKKAIAAIQAKSDFNESPSIEGLKKISNAKYGPGGSEDE